ncbi:hypothetical protein EYF80_066762 [Liparis tanakae]|uniref:Uncharacterized protein n=1 Tax=Liparis tanakae TaxID=230148 RepID=A0A4Z2E3I3_9TELE|nr:hypothetical protein EYF80_066762 [Liparis tanakae]
MENKRYLTGRNITRHRRLFVPSTSDSAERPGDVLPRRHGNGVPTRLGLHPQKVRQGPSGPVRVRQGPSGLIRVRQGPSGPVRVRQGPSGPIRVRQGRSGSIRVHQGPSGPIRAHQGPSGPIRARQVPHGVETWKRPGVFECYFQAWKSPRKKNEIPKYF